MVRLGNAIYVPHVRHKQRCDLPSVPDSVCVFAWQQGGPDARLTGAWAAFGPFIFTGLIGMAITKTGSAIPFFIGVAVYYGYSWFLNYWYYTRKGAERFDYGNSGGTWWDKLSAAEKEKMKQIDLHLHK